MASIIETVQYIPRARVREVGVDSRVYSAFPRQGHMPPVAYALLKGRDPTHFVTAFGLARLLMPIVDESNWRSLRELSFAALIEDMDDFAAVGGTRLHDAISLDGEPPLVSENHVAPVNFRDARVGYFVTPGHLLFEIYTEPLPYRCANGHPNGSPDTGRCSQLGCLAKLQ